MTDDRYTAMLASLVEGTLDPAGFSHRDHIGVAVAALRQHSFFEAMLVVAAGLQAMTQRAGVPEKFNATVTMASVSLIAERLEMTPCGSIDDFIECHADLLSPSLLRNAYPDERWTSDLARRIGLLPGVGQAAPVTSRPSA